MLKEKRLPGLQRTALAQELQWTGAILAAAGDQSSIGNGTTKQEVSSL